MGAGIFLLIPILVPILAGTALFFIHNRMGRRITVATTVIVNAAFVFAISFFTGDSNITIWKFSDSLSIYFHFDSLGKIFACVIALVWAAVSIYAFEYMTHEGKEERYFAFSTITLGILIGITMAGNLMTMYMFYEMMTLITIPLVVHSQGREAIRAGLKYLGYSVFGAGLALIGFFFLNSYGTSTTFTLGGVLDMSKIGGNHNGMLVIFVLMFIGFGCKAGLIPLQAWLPTAHPVAPAPASALLSGIITKMGVLAILRVTFYLFDPNFIKGTWAQTLLLILTLATVFVGSMLAFKEKGLKKRLAYSTVSQVSYVLFGIILLSPAGFLGAILQVIFHAFAKNLLFLSAGAIIYKTGITRVDELKGVGKKMPITMWCFTIGSLSLIGIPPLAGFVSKWFLAEGALTANVGAFAYIGPAVLLVSALLTAGYLLPIVRDGFFPGKDFNYKTLVKSEPTAFMVVPLILLSLGVIGFGLFPGGLIHLINGISSTIF